MQQRIDAGVAPARTLARARILLKAEQSPSGSAFTDDTIAEAAEVSQSTVARIRKHYVQKGFAAALHASASGRQYRRKLDGAQ